MKLLLISTMLIVSVHVSAQREARIVSFDQLESRISQTEKPLLVVNFWATWCGPCIKELPYFEAVFQERSKDMDLILVNLDFADKITKVNTFIGKQELTGDVLLLDNLDYNSWIDKIDPSWSGAIPATLLINTRSGERIFLEGEMDKSKLDTYINKLLL